MENMKMARKRNTHPVIDWLGILSVLLVAALFFITKTK